MEFYTGYVKHILHYDISIQCALLPLMVSYNDS